MTSSEHAQAAGRIRDRLTSFIENTVPSHADRKLIYRMIDEYAIECRSTGLALATEAAEGASS